MNVFSTRMHNENIAPGDADWEARGQHAYWAKVWEDSVALSIHLRGMCEAIETVSEELASVAVGSPVQW